MLADVPMSASGPVPTGAPAPAISPTETSSPRAPLPHQPAPQPLAPAAPAFLPGPLVRRPDVTWDEIFRGPFEVSQLFSMPTANVVGAYQLRLYGDASLLTERDVLSTSGVVALGFGDLAQLEYRQSTAVSHRVRSERELLGLPALGVQFEVPLRERRYVPRLGVALRFGLPLDQRGEPAAGALVSPSYQERATDLYLVASLALPRLSLHVGTRITAASLESTRQTAELDLSRRLILPTVGVSYAVTPRAALMLEAALVPRFDLPTETSEAEIGSDPYARTGVRWNALPWLTVDASIGYHLELQRKNPPSSSSGDALVDWDLRLGGELAVPWGAVLCRATAWFCS